MLVKRALVAALVAALAALPLAGVAAAEAPDALRESAVSTTTDHDEYQVCIWRYDRYECYAVVTVPHVPDVPPVCYYTGPPPHGEYVCLN